MTAREVGAIPVIPDGSVIITPAQMYEQIGHLTEEVRKLRDTVGPSLNDIRNDVKHHGDALATADTERTKLGTRLTIIETKMRAMWAACGLLIAAAAAIAGFLGHSG